MASQVHRYSFADSELREQHSTTKQMAYRDHNLGKLLKLANTEGLQQADAAQGLDEGFTVCSTRCHYRSEGIGIELEQHTCSARPIRLHSCHDIAINACDIGSRICFCAMRMNVPAALLHKVYWKDKVYPHAVYILLASHNQQVARMMHICVTPSAHVRKVQYAQ